MTKKYPVAYFVKKTLTKSANTKLWNNEGKQASIKSRYDARRTSGEETDVHDISNSVPYYVYLLECADGSIYTGITTDVDRRFAEHQRGIGSNFTRAKKAKRMLYSEKHPDRSLALVREAEIKKWPRAKKVLLVSL